MCEHGGQKEKLEKQKKAQSAGITYEIQFT